MHLRRISIVVFWSNGSGLTDKSYKTDADMITKHDFLCFMWFAGYSLILVHNFLFFFNVWYISSTVHNTSMNPSLLGKNILLIFSGSVLATVKSNINFRILISRAFRLTSQFFTANDATADIRQNMILSNLFDW